MTKGRQFAPLTVNEGTWFQHRGLPNIKDTISRRFHTSTGVMYAASVDAEARNYPPPPPPKYRHRESFNYKNENNFSLHDNRHSFQGHGVYYGDGKGTRLLGKRLITSGRQQQFTDPTFLSHQGENIRNLCTVYKNEFQTKSVPNMSKCHRYPYTYREPRSAPVHLSTSTTKWFPPTETPNKTHLEVLALTQQPFLKNNPWNYSYHGQAKCYPPYDRVDPKKPYPIWMINGNSDNNNNVTVT